MIVIGTFSILHISAFKHWKCWVYICHYTFDRHEQDRQLTVNHLSCDSNGN